MKQEFYIFIFILIGRSNFYAYFLFLFPFSVCEIKLTHRQPQQLKLTRLVKEWWAKKKKVRMKFFSFYLSYTGLSFCSYFIIAPKIICLLPHCMECRRGLGMRILSVCPSVCPSHAWIVTKRKKDLSRFIYHMKEHLA